jgi:hypothetical protein
MAIITLEALHQHVLELAGDLPVEWIDKLGPSLFMQSNQKAPTLSLCMRSGISATVNLTIF